MIDDYAQATALVNKMNASVPIPVRPTRQLVDTLRQKGVSLGHDPKLEIKKVFYMGDEAGIMCDVTPPGMETTPIKYSFTHAPARPAEASAGRRNPGVPADACGAAGARRRAGGKGIATLQRRKGDR